MKFKLRLSLSAIFLILTIPSFIGFLAFSYKSNLEIYKSNAEGLLSQHNNEVADKLANLLNPIDDSIRVIRKQLTDDPGLFTNPKFVESLALHLANNPNLVSIFTASSDGAYRQVNSIVGPKVILADRVAPDGAVMAVWKVDRAKNQVKAVSEYAFYKTMEPFDSIGAFEVPNNYDPRDRPLFKAVVKSMATMPAGNFIQFDPPYIAASTKKPTLSASTPIVVNNVLLGIHSQSFSLDTIAKFLTTSRISPNSEAFIVDEAGNIIVRTKFDQGFTVEKGQFKSRKITDFADSPLSYVAKARAGAKDHILHFNFGPDKKEYVAKFTPIENNFNKKWEVLTIAPMADFLEKRLEPHTRSELEAHLQKCPQCVTQLRTYESTVTLLRSLRDDDLPPDLRLRVRSFLDARCHN